MKRVTCKMVADAVGVSKTTVSFVLNNRPSSISKETRERVLEAARHLGYSFQENAAAPQVRENSEPVTIGLLTPTLSNLFYPALLQQIEVTAQSREICVVTMNTLYDPENEKRYLKRLEDGLIDGMLCLFAPQVKLPINKPIVVINDETLSSMVDIVSLNSLKAGYLVADYLLSLGHRRLAYISSPFNRITTSRRLRMEGVSKRLGESGLQDSLTVLCDAEETESGDVAFEYRCGYRLTEQLLRTRSSVTAIIAVNDTTALGCIVALKDHGIRVPQDISVCGFDNIPLCEMMTPSLTSVDQMAKHGGKVALDLLLDKIRHGSETGYPAYLQYQPCIVARESVAAPGNRHR